MSDRILAYAIDKYREDTRDLLDDPSWLVHPDETEKPSVWIAAHRQLGVDLGLDFDALCKELGTDFEQKRLRDYEAEV